MLEDHLQIRCGLWEALNGSEYVKSACSWFSQQLYAAPAPRHKISMLEDLLRQPLQICFCHTLACIFCFLSRALRRDESNCVCCRVLSWAGSAEIAHDTYAALTKATWRRCIRPSHSLAFCLSLLATLRACCSQNLSLALQTRWSTFAPL